MDLIGAGPGISCGVGVVFAEAVVLGAGARVSRLPGGLHILTGVICLLYSITHIELWELKKRIEITKRLVKGLLFGLSVCFFVMFFVFMLGGLITPEHNPIILNTSIGLLTFVAIFYFSFVLKKHEHFRDIAGANDIVAIQQHPGTRKSDR